MNEASGTKRKHVFSYERLYIRLLVTVIAVCITCAVWAWIYAKNPTAANYIVFENLWLTCAYAISLIVTGVLFSKIYFTTNGEVRRAGFIGFFIFAGLLILCICSALFASKSHIILTCLPAIVALVVFGYDGLLARAGLPGLKDGKWIHFDLAVFVGVVIVILIRLYLPFLSPELKCVFGGGGASFQLIMANMVFDPKTYT